MSPEPAKVGQRGTAMIAPKFGEEYGMKEGQPVIMEATPHGVLIKASVAVPVRQHTPSRDARRDRRGAHARIPVSRLPR